MIKHICEKTANDPLLSSAACLAGWAALSHLLLFITDKLLVHMLTLMVCFGMIYPVASLVMFYRLGKRHGILWYFYAAVTVITVAEYVLWDTYRAIMPNMIIMTVLCVVFGCGIGSCFTDKERLAAEKEARRLKRTGEDQPYESILGSGTGKRKK